MSTSRTTRKAQRVIAFATGLAVLVALWSYGNAGALTGSYQASSWGKLRRRLQIAPSASPEVEICIPKHNLNDIDCGDDEALQTEIQTELQEKAANATSREAEDLCGYTDVHADPEQSDIATTLTLVAASLSLCGGIFMFITFIVLSEMRSPTTIVVFNLAIANLISSVGSLLQAHQSPAYDNVTCCPTPICYAEATIGNFAELAAVFWSLCIATQAYLQIVIGLRPRGMRRSLPFFFGFAWGMPLVLTIWAGAGGYFGPAGAVCWIPSVLVFGQGMFYYGWAILVDLVIAYMLTHIGFAVRGTKSNGVTTRFMLYAIWAVVTSFGFIVMRMMEWAAPCEDTSFVLSCWNSFVAPLSGFGYAIIYVANRNVIDGWKRRLCSKPRLEQKALNSVSQVEMSGATDAATEGSVLEDEEYSDDDD